MAMVEDRDIVKVRVTNRVVVTFRRSIRELCHFGL